MLIVALFQRLEQSHPHQRKLLSVIRAYQGGALFNDGSGYDDDLTDDIPDYSARATPRSQM
ncbi:MAG: hypothetical protein R2880_02150 [Deinococcales bacterium]